MIDSISCSLDRLKGKESAAPAPSFVRYSALKGQERVLDIGCGTGGLGRALQGLGRNFAIRAVDPSPEYVGRAFSELEAGGIEVSVDPTKALPFDDDVFDATLSLLPLEEFPSPGEALAEMMRVTHPGGTVAACQWDIAEGKSVLSLFWKAAEAALPAEVRHFGERNEMPSPGRTESDALASARIEAGLRHVEARRLPIIMTFRSFDDFWGSLLEGTTPSALFMRLLDAAAQSRLAQTLSEMLPRRRADGSFTLFAQAVAVIGTVPEAIGQRRAFDAKCPTSRHLMSRRVA